MLSAKLQQIKNLLLLKYSFAYFCYAPKIKPRCFDKDRTELLFRMLNFMSLLKILLNINAFWKKFGGISAVDKNISYNS